MVDKIVFVFFLITYYFLFVRGINFLYPGLLALSALSGAGIMTLIGILPVSALLSYITVKYIRH